VDVVGDLFAGVALDPVHRRTVGSSRRRRQRRSGLHRNPLWAR
jgi:hypothetical protein